MMKASSSGDTVPCSTTMAKAISSAGNYHRWVFDAIKRHLNRDSVTFEIGAGHGEYTKLLSCISKKVVATDISQEAVARITDEHKQDKKVEVMLMNGIEKDKIQNPVGNVVAINILEHIRDDDAFVRDCFSILERGGKLVVFAPAFCFLFSNMDRQAGHFRRYSRNGLADILRNNGFRIVSSRYFNFIGFWGWAVNKFTGSGVDSSITNLQVVFFDKYVWLFKCFEFLTFFCGQSILVVGERT